MTTEKKHKEKSDVKRLIHSLFEESANNSPKSKWTLVAVLEDQKVQTTDFEELAGIALNVGLTKKEYASFLHINPRTLDRNLNEKYTLDLDKSEKILRISQMIKRGVDIFGSDEKFSRWIREYNTALQKKPIELFTTIAGIDLIENVLTRLEHGIYS